MKSPRRILTSLRYWIQDTLDVRFSGNPLRGIGTFFRHLFLRMRWALGKDHEKALTTREVTVTESDEAVLRDRPSAENYLNPLFVASLFVDWLKRWITSRPALAMLQAIPAIVIGVSLVFAMSPISGASKTQAIKNYQHQSQVAFAAEQNETADLCMRKLCSLEPSDLSYQFQRADFLANTGEVERATTMMGRLADQGHADSNMWLGARQFSEYEKSPEDFPELEKQFMLRNLLKVVSVRPSDADANRLLGLIYIQEQNTERAIPHLKEATRTRPELAYTLSRLFYRSNDFLNAEMFARQALPVVEEKHELDPVSDPINLRLVSLRLMVGEESEAIDELIEVGKLVNNTLKYKTAIAECYVEWSRRVLREDGGDFSTRFPGQQTIDKCVELVDKALQFDPLNQFAIQQLGLFATLPGDSEKILEPLRNILTQRPSMAAHFVLGSHALVNDQLDVADVHFTQAYQDGEQVPALLNNMAMLRHRMDRNQEALELANRAIGLKPGVPHFHDTRGQIHKKAGRLVECAADFEKALPAADLQLETHRVLVEVYRELGESALADAHAKHLN